ncbi:C4-dicarboxylate ABC transporter [Sulfurifustis variabilis]|uniref:C4-dicarboxylate ABC transporter n=1 Tax=Sulfurifustis variabilis TaxID=1675686 RepID=A0A1C7AG24_9GAMM|nr:TRAP transporter substrate-binding protein DctP [Sulfurifustis variabilis]BAU50408.1 C4-dicarboxylate ABC transporter [Sulfurifustis variabilis]
MERRDFMRLAGVAALAGAAAACDRREEPASTQEASKPATKLRWKLTTAWPPNFPIFHDGVTRFAREVEAMSGGRLHIDVYGGGELVPPLETFNAVSQGTVQMGHAAAYYWAGKVPAAQFFTTVPFGMNAQGVAAWLTSGGGLSLWEEIYKPFNLVPIPMGNTGVQMGGWFNKRIGRLEDLKGLRIRTPGLGGRVMASAGANPVLLPGAEIYTALERSTIDAAEWVGPYHDERMGLYRAAKYYYYPGWQEPGPVLELLVNSEAWAKLPDDLRLIVRAAAATVHNWIFAEFEAKNHEALQLLTTKYKVQIVPFPVEVLRALRSHAKAVLEDEAAKHADFKRVYEAYASFQSRHEAWSTLSEAAYMEALKS